MDDVRDEGGELVFVDVERGGEELAEVVELRHLEGAKRADTHPE